MVLDIRKRLRIDADPRQIRRFMRQFLRPLRWPALARTIRKSILLNNYDDMDTDLLGSRLRNTAHFLDTAKQRLDKESVQHLSGRLQDMLDIWEKKAYPVTPDVIWAKHLLSAKPPRRKESATEDSSGTLNNAIYGRRSIRQWKHKNVAVKSIDEILRAASWAPNSCNRQTWKFMVLKSRRMMKLYSEVRVGHAMPMITECGAVIVVGIDTRSYVEHERYSFVLDAGVAVQNMCLKAHDMNLGTCILNWNVADETKESNFRSKLGVPPYCEILCAVLVGYPKSAPLAPARKPLDSIRGYERYPQ